MVLPPPPSTLLPYTTLFRSGPVKTFSIGYDSDYPSYQNELHFARRMADLVGAEDRKSTRLNSSHRTISYAVFCLKKKTSRRLPPGFRCSSLAALPVLSLSSR